LALAKEELDMGGGFNGAYILYTGFVAFTDIQEFETQRTW